MLRFERKQISELPEIKALWMQLRATHKPADHTREVIMENKHIENFCEQATHFIAFMGKDIFLHYEIDSYYKPVDEILVRVLAIVIYDNFIEYETARMKALHGGGVSSGANLN